MNKPFTLVVNETRENLISIVNSAKLPAFCMKVILNDILEQIEDIDKKEIENYKKETEKILNKSQEVINSNSDLEERKEE